MFAKVNRQGQDEKTLLQIIRYSPSIIIVLIFTLIISIMYDKYEKDLIEDQIAVEKQFISNEKSRIRENVNNVYNYMQQQYNSNSTKLKKQVKHQVYNAYAIANSIYNKNKDKKSKEEITEIIKDALRDIRFNGDRGYFFIYDLSATNILHPTEPTREGNNYFYDKDVTGVYRNQIALKIIKDKGEGFFNWFFNKPNDTKTEYEKMGFVKKFEPYDWFIGTGEYVKDFEKNLQKNVLKHISLLNFKNDGFIGVISYEGDVLYHKSKRVLGGNIFEEKKFTHIKAFYKDLLINKKLDGFDVHKMKVQDTKIQNETKTLYSKKFESWKWFISTGFRLSDAQPIIEQKKEKLKIRYEQYKNAVLLYGSALTILLLFFSFIMSKMLEKKFIKHKLNLENQIKKNVEQKEILLIAQEVAHIGDWQLDLATNKGRWSKEILRIFGIENKNVQAGPEYLKSIMHKDDIHCFVDSMQNCIKTFEEHRCIYRIYRPNGEIRWIECRGQLSKDRNSILGTVQDITEAKEMEIQKQLKDEMMISQSRSAAMGEMISLIAHQWRQPLSVISMHVNNTMLDIALDNLDKDEIKNNSMAILEQTEHLSKTIDDFKDFFKPNREKEVESLKNVFNDAMKFMLKSFENHSINYTVKSTTDEKVLIFSRELLQVFINILKNAKEVLQEKNDAPRELNVEISNINNNIQIKICNNGKQIKSSDLLKIFEPYYSTKNEKNGTGLGLYMSKLIIEEHMGGKISAQNVDDKVCFVIEIPISKAD